MAKRAKPKWKELYDEYNPTSKSPAWKRVLFHLVSNTVADGEGHVIVLPKPKWSLENLKKSAFYNYNDNSAKARLSKVVSNLQKDLEEAGGINFIEITEDNIDNRKKLIYINDGKLKIWLDNIFNYHRQTQISTSYAFNFKRIALFDNTSLHPRLIFLQAFFKWNDVHFPSKEHLSGRVYNFVSEESKWKKQ